MRIVISPQEYKGTLTAEEAAAAMAQGARRALPDADLDVVPLPDGGPGTVRAIVSITGGDIRPTRVQDPRGRPVDAEWALLPDGSAVIEMAAASGLVLVPENERDPRSATTNGVGELLRAALDAGARRLIIGLGGSATNDGGGGMTAALGGRFLDDAGHELPPGGAALAHLARIDVTNLDPRVREAEIVGASDVTNPLCGPEGASLIYGPQKGASPQVARELDLALKNYARVVARDLGVSVADVPGAGAAGGLGAGLIAFLGADIRPGVEVVAAVVGLRERLQGADLVLTGEGRLDGQTRYGKTVAGVARMASDAGVQVIVVPGTLGDGWESILSLVAHVEAIVAQDVTPEDAMSRPAELLAATVERVLMGAGRRGPTEP
ncbi:MAG: glycerate kinase [Dehalococcoidia bacterium]